MLTPRGVAITADRPPAAAPGSSGSAADLATARRCLPWLAVAALCLENLDATIVNTAVPTMAQSLDVALGGLLAAYFLGHVDQTSAAQPVPALHRAFAVMGALTMVSSATFWGLRATDGDNVSNRQVNVVAAR